MIDQRGKGMLEAEPGVAAGRGQCLRDQLALDLLRNRAEQPLLASKMVIDRAGRHARIGRDILKARRLVPTLAKAPSPGLEQCRDSGIGMTVSQRSHPAP
jgi:hypothetical protein